jgi:tetratricopeptide (TPR) repeat protein
MARDRSISGWSLTLAASGLLCLALTFHEYRFKSGISSSNASTIRSWSASEADQRLLSAQAYLKDHPEDIDALTQEAIALYSKGPDFYVDAMNALEKARSLGATDAALFFYAGVMYEALGLPDYAINDLQRYLRHRPDDYEAQIRLANLFFRTGADDAAYQQYQQAIKEWPKDATVLFNYAVVCVKKGDTANAERALADVRQLAGSLPVGGLFQEGEIARLKGSDDHAIEFYQQEIAQHPDYLPALEALDAALRRKGDLKTSHEVRAKISELKSSHHGP